MTEAELIDRYGPKIRAYTRQIPVQWRDCDDLLNDVLIGHMTGFLPHMGGFRDQSADFQRLTLLLHEEIGRIQRRGID